VKSWIVVGAGATGLAAAWHLARRGHAVTVLEKEPCIGGLARGFGAGAARLDVYYHHLFPGQAEILSVANELGMAGDIAFRPARMGFWAGGRMFPFDTAADLLRFSPLPPTDRLRFGLASLRLARRRSWEDLDDRTAADLLREHFGEKSWATVWEPLLANKFGPHAQAVSAAWVWDRFSSRSRSRRPRGESLGGLDGGFVTLLERMADDITGRGGRVLTGITARRVLVSGGAFAGLETDGEIFRADGCVVTTPLPSFLDMVPDLPRAWVEPLRGIPYAAVACLVLRLRGRLTPFYWTNVADSSLPFAVVVEHTNWMEPTPPDRDTIVYLAAYRRAGESGGAEDDETFIEACLRGLGRIVPGFDPGRVTGRHLFRDPFAQPVFLRGHGKVRPGFDTPLTGLHLVNGSQVYPRSRTLNTCFALAREFSDRVADGPPVQRRVTR
jgi:protoporphyrinogen oxidase